MIKNRKIAYRAAVAVAALGLMLMTSEAAHADVAGTTAASPDLNIRLATGGAGSDILNSPIAGSVPYGSTVHIVCAWNFANIDGPWGWTTVWDAIDYYTTPDGVQHWVNPSDHGWDDNFVSDAWVNTGGDTSTMVPACYGGG
jgi:uncharacterized protein YraI